MSNNLFTRMLGVESMGPHGRYIATPADVSRSVVTGRGLGDDGSVMMISGLGDQLGSAPINAIPAGPSGTTNATLAALQTPIKLFSIELPLWAWLVIAALSGGAGGYYLGRR